MNSEKESIVEQINLFLSKLNSSYMDKVAPACDMSSDPETAEAEVSTFLLDTLQNDIILELPKNDVIYSFIHTMVNHEDIGNGEIPYQSSNFSHKEYVDYINGLHIFERKIEASLDVTNEIEYAGNLVNVFENDKKFIEALFDSEVIAEKTGHDITMTTTEAFYEFSFLLNFRDYLTEAGKEIQRTSVSISDSVVRNRLRMLYISSIAFYAWKHVESVLNTMKEAASVIYKEETDDAPEIPYGIF